MPRHARLDAPETLQHVMGRGIERTARFREERERVDCVARLAAVAGQGAWTVDAWALLPTHAHLLVRTGPRPLARSLRALLTGEAGAVSRRQQRGGPLCPNRYKSSVVEAEPDRVELVRSLHLNPVRATVLPDLRRLDRSPWTGHSALLGTMSRPWQTPAEILARFGPIRARARTAYRAFVAAGLPHGRRPELQGGGVVRSLGGGAAVQALRRGREASAGDERILGTPAFVARLQQALPVVPAGRRLALATVLTRVCRAVGIPAAALAGGGRTAPLTRARNGIADLWVAVLGHPGRPLAPLLGVRPQAVYAAVQRGRAGAREWEALLGKHSGKETV